MRLIFFSLLLSGSSIWSTNYFLSEAMLKGSAKWLELTFFESVEIHKISVFVDGKEWFKNLERPRRVGGFLILANSPEFLQPMCIKDDLAVIFGDFALPGRGDFSVCVALNDSPKSCMVIKNALKIPHGISVYRENPTGILLFEPCHLGQNIFATPGLVGRSCLEEPEAFLKKFTLCDDLREKPIQVDAAIVTQIALSDVTKAEDGHTELTFKVPGSNWVRVLGRRSGSNIEYELDPWRVVLAGQQQKVKVKNPLGLDEFWVEGGL